MSARTRSRWLVGIGLLVVVIALIRFVAHDPVGAPASSIATTSVAQSPSLPAPLQTIPETTHDNVPPSASGALRGKVIDAITRKPVREFTVEFFQARGTGWRRDTPTGRDFRTQDGRFEWRPAPAGVWMIAVGASGYQRFEIDGLLIEANGETSELVMPLRPGFSVRGRVFDKTSGAGIPEATVSFREAHVAPFAGNFRARPRTLTSKDGSFVFTGVPSGRVTLNAYARGYSAREVDVTVDEITPSMEIALSTGARISGRLVAQDGMTAVAGSVGLFNLDGQHGSSGRTHELGEFDFRQLPPGRYRLTGRAGRMTTERDVVLSDDQHLEGVTLVLATGRTLRGTVSGLSSDELSRVRISLSRPEMAAPDLSPTEIGVDSRGSFEIEGVQAGQVVLRATTDSRVARQTVDVPTDADVSVDIRFPPGFRVSGRITRAGKPLAGVDVGLFVPGDENFESLGAVTAQDGRYVISNVPRGQYTVSVGEQYEGGTLLLSEDTEFDVDVPATGLKGDVTDERGKVSIVGARIYLWSTMSSPRATRRQAQTDHFGRFLLGALDPGSYMLTVLRPGFAMHREQIEFPSQSSVSIRLSAEDGVSVQARDTTSGKELTRLLVSERFAGSDELGIGMTVPLDEKGTGRIPRALAGSTLTFHVHGCEPINFKHWSGQALQLAFRCSTSQSEQVLY